jgi:2-keto-3-deoxy-L-fuconate dehydrogenase
MSGLSGYTALVTGAARGIGHAVATALLNEGADVASLDLVRDGHPDGSVPLIADLRDGRAVKEAIDDFCKKRQRLDVLVANGAVSFVGGIEDGNEADWARVLDINVTGQMRTVRAALPWLRRSEAGSIVFMTSCSALNGIPQRSLYSASKGAVQAMAMSLATDMLAEKIRVNCVSPGTVDTPFVSEIISRAPDPDGLRAAFEHRQPTGHMVDPAEVAHAVVYLANRRARSITGTVLVVDGGMGTLRPEVSTNA